MGIRLSGDFGTVKGWASRMDKLRSARFRRSLLSNIGEELLELVREGFDAQADPYGAGWAPLKRRSGRILQDTGRLRNSFHRSALSSNSVTVAAGAAYAVFHQNGTRRMVARKMLPDRGWPAGWMPRVNAIAQEALEKTIGG